VVPLGLSEIGVEDERCKAEEIPVFTYVVRLLRSGAIREA